MRITTGKYKGRILNIPKGIRPTQEKVRKAFFDILGDIEGKSFLELFAGSGAVGLEALSRGVNDLALVEYDRQCQIAIQKNIDSLKVKTCTLFPRGVKDALEQLTAQKRKFDVIFLDPPYYAEEAKKTLQLLSACDILSPNGLIVVQHFKKDSLPESLGDLMLFRQSKYGDTLLSFYRNKIKKSVI